MSAKQATMLGKAAMAACAIVTAGRVGAVSPPPAIGIEDARLVETTVLKGELFHVQGVDLDRAHIWVTSVDLQNHRGYLHEFDRTTGAFVRRVELTDGDRFHPGGISRHGDAIWVPVAEMRPASSAVIEEIDARTFAVRRKIAVPDHIGCVAVRKKVIIAGNWDSRLLYVFDDQGRELQTVSNPFPTRYQDMKLVRNTLVASGLLTSSDGSVDWISWPSMRLVVSRHAAAAASGKAYSSEGMAIEGRDLFFVPEDGPSRLYRFRLRSKG